MRDAPRVAALAFLLMVLLPIAAGAPPQTEACRRPLIEISDGPAEWTPGQRWVMLVAVVNANEAPVESVTARIDVSTPPGWAASVARPTLTLGPQNVTVDPVAVTAPQRGTGLARGEIVVAVHFTCHRGTVDASAQTTAVVPVALVPPRIPWVLVGGLVLLLAAAVVLAYWLRSRQPRVGVAATTTERRMKPGERAQFPLVVVNRRREPDAVVLTIVDPPPGWIAHLAADEVELEPREERSLWLLVRAPAGATAGDEARLTVRASSRKTPEDVAYVEVRARVDE